MDTINLMLWHSEPVDKTLLTKLQRSSLPYSSKYPWSKNFVIFVNLLFLDNKNLLSRQNGMNHESFKPYIIKADAVRIGIANALELTFLL